MSFLLLCAGGCGSGSAVTSLETLAFDDSALQQAQAPRQLVIGPRSGPRSPVRVIEDSPEASERIADRVLFRRAGAAVVREALASDMDFQDVYVVSTPELERPLEIFDELGETLLFAPGRFAVLRVSPERIAELSDRMHATNHACGAIIKLDGTPELVSARAPRPTPIIPVTSRDSRVAAATAKIDAENIRGTMRELSDITTRFHASTTGQGVTGWLAAKYTALAAGRSDVAVTTYDHGSATPQHSLIVRITGKTRPTEVLILGSHIDSITRLDVFGRSPGADDNASGTATNLEIFRVLMAEGIALERTLEIHGYAAEEIGLVGSNRIAADYAARKVNVIAMVQFDMTAWQAAGATDKLWLETADTDTGLNNLLASLVDGYTGMPSGKASSYVGSSDHYSWMRKGYAVAYPGENPKNFNRALHTVNDDLTIATAFGLVAGCAKLGLAYAMHFAGLP